MFYYVMLMPLSSPTNGQKLRIEIHAHEMCSIHLHLYLFLMRTNFNQFKEINFKRYKRLFN